MKHVFVLGLVIFTVRSVVAQDGQSKTLPITSTSYWHEVFFDDFRGKPDSSARSTYCFDQLKPQCHVWSGGYSHDCDQMNVTGTGSFPPLRENMVAAIKTVDSGPWESKPFPVVQARYSQLLTDNLRHLDKCTWTVFENLNPWATDYHGHYSSRFDGSQVRVDPTGKGRLLLSAVSAPVQTDCAFGGTKAGPNCQVYAFGSNDLMAGVHYWADPDPRWPGVYYEKINGTCPFAGTSAGPNCQLHAFTPGILEEKGVEYWVDTDPPWPGVYYKDKTSYRCDFNIDYLSTGVHFRNLTCPILNGAVLSARFINLPFVDPTTGASVGRGRSQFRGRFEVKARIPRALGAFPAAWMMPDHGGWPYLGGEIDIMEARDAANEVYQTYHHGKCFTQSPTIEHLVEPDACAAINGATSVHLSRGYTLPQATPDEFWLRDHVFAVEWTDAGFTYYVNNLRVGTVHPGTAADTDPAGSYPPGIAQFTAANLPTSPFYWILNHSAFFRQPQPPTPPTTIGWDFFHDLFDFYVHDLNTYLLQTLMQTSFPQQTYAIDWVRSYEECRTDADFCPCGGSFEEGVGCILATGGLACPTGVTPPLLVGNIYQSNCHPVRHDCIYGGSVAGPNCQVRPFQNPEVIPTIKYWVDTDPRWPGVYYAKINGQCPFGGAGAVNCQLKSFTVPALYVVAGVNYWVDTNPAWPGVYYAPINGQCPYGGGQGVNCQLIAFPAGKVISGRAYWVDTNPRWPGVYYGATNGQCLLGGTPAGPNCQILAFQNPEVIPSIKYWVDTDPRWPGVYYAKINGQCPFGGAGAVNCQLKSFTVPSLYVVAGVNYWVDTNPAWPGVYYAPINGQCPYGGGQGVNCQLVAFASDVLETGVHYWVDTDPRWPGVYYAPDFR